MSGFNRIDNINIGMPTAGRPVTATLYVSPDGNNTNGINWVNAYTTLNSALDAASTDANDLTLILVAPHATYYDINTAGDPTWSANVEIMAPHRRWVPIKNTHASATSILKLTGKASVIDLAFSQQGAVSGLIMTNNGFRVRNCGFNSTTCTGAVNGLYLDGTAALMQGGKVEGCQFLGHQTYTTAIKANNIGVLESKDINIHDALVGISIDGASSMNNFFDDIDIGKCTTGINIIDGEGVHLDGIHFHSCTTRISDAAITGNSFKNLTGQFDMALEPDDLTGVTVTANNVAGTWGADVEVRSAAAATKPFKIVGYGFEPSVTQKHKVRFTGDNGSTYFDEIGVEEKRNTASEAGTGTEHIFNVGTQIKASCKAETGGEDTIKVWLKIQAI